MREFEQIRASVAPIEKKEEIPNNFVIVDRPEGKFRIAYERHDRMSPAEDVGEADACVLETGLGDYSTREGAEKMLHPKGEENIGSPIEEIYPKIFERLKEKRKPIFFADLTKAKTAEILRLVLGTIESGVGYALLGALAHEAAKNKSTQPMSRRDFLKKAGIGVAGAYFATHSIRNILAEHSGDPLDQKSKTAMVNRVMTSLNEEIHPEIDGILITLRNYLVAQKMTTIARILKVDSDRKPEVAAIFGAGHFGLEKALSVGDEKRAEMIDKLLISNGLENVRKEIATIARLDFDEIKNDWAVTEIFKDPVLAPLEKK